MADIWSFLLQTLTASGTAALLLVLKAMFRDKLSPRWQFAVWGVLGLVLLVPAGLGGRYVLFNWPWLVETAKTFLTGDYGLTRVTAPIPLPALRVPGTWAEWVFAVYVLGVLSFLGRYAVSYVRLRAALRQGSAAGEAQASQIAAVAEQYDLPVCPAVAVPGLTSAFVCGVFRPVLALPAGEAVDSKVLLHELLHLKHRDAAWGLVICLFRCLHWCNPLLWYCAGRAGNDLESLCDQRVLERLEGEARRDYGRILLAMADERYAHIPGTSSMANGGQNIRRRIEAIARFKKYPAGMGLVSVCVTLLLASSLLLGGRAKAVYTGGYTLPQGMDIHAAMASARTIPCTTYAGAMDAYAKAVLDRNPLYRAMSAPLSEHPALAAELRQAAGRSDWPHPTWDPGLPGPAKVQSGYVYYNIEETGPGIWEGLLTVELESPPDGWETEDARSWAAFQPVRAECLEGRWFVTPLEDFQAVPTFWGSLPTTSCEQLPACRLYEAQAGDFTLRLRYQTTYTVDSYKSSGGFFSASVYDTTPQIDAVFKAYDSEEVWAVYTGDPEQMEQYVHLGVSCAPMALDEERPTLSAINLFVEGGGSSSDGSSWGTVSLESGWGPAVCVCGGGSSADPENFIRPEAFAADLYLNREKAAELTLLPVEGGPQ